MAAATLALALPLSGCALRHGGPHMRYEDAKQELVRLVETPLLATLDGKRPSVEPLTGEGLCDDALGMPIDEATFTYRFEFPVDLLGDNPERLLAEAERAWREAGLTIKIDDIDPRAPAIFAGDERGFNFQAYVNYDKKRALISGTGPCVEPPEPTPTSQ